MFRCVEYAFFFLYLHAPHHHLHSFPTRRSSDLKARWATAPGTRCNRRGRSRSSPSSAAGRRSPRVSRSVPGARREGNRDRKSTRLNSSHITISYAVFCLKKKTRKIGNDETRTLG